MGGRVRTGGAVGRGLAGVRGGCLGGAFGGEWFRAAGVCVWARGACLCL